MTEQIPDPIANESLVPIIVGVTGHRFVVSRWDDLIAEVFIELHAKYPYTPIVVLSPLAEGADRLVAQVALDLKKTQEEFPISLICPLPMPRSEYENDFKEKDGSNDEFSKFLDECLSEEDWFELPMVGKNTVANIAGKKTIIRDGKRIRRRDLQYEQVGKYIAQHSHILLALWDGIDEPGKTGGTSQIVKMRHEGTLKPGRNLLDEIDSGPVYHFKTTEIPASETKKAGEVIRPRREVFPDMRLNSVGRNDQTLSKQKRERFDLVLKGLDSFNRDVKEMRDEVKRKIKENVNPVLPQNEVKELTDFSKRVLHHYTIADSLAMYYQERFTRTLKLLFRLVILALAFFEVYAHMLPNWPLLLLCYPLVLGIGLGFFLHARKKKYQSKYLDFRALAEGLRVQFFWILSGRDDEVVDYYLPKQKTELDWIKYAVRSVNMSFSRKEYLEKTTIDNGLTENTPLRLERLVLYRWIKAQANYFTAKAPELQRQLETYHSVGRDFIYFGIGMAIFLFILQLICGGGHGLTENHGFEITRHIVIILIAMALAVAAAIGGYTEKAAISALAKRYWWMSGIYNRAEIELEKLLRKGKTAEAQQLIVELGKAALEENADWLIIRRERELEVPTG